MLSRSTKVPAKAFVRSFASNEVKFEVTRPFKGHKLTPPSNTVTATKDECIGYYKSMVYYRRFEMVADMLYKERLIRGFCHLYDGQEAIVTGMEASIKKTDSVITAYREHCHQLARGDTGVSVMSELMGKATGCSKGKGGSMHMYFNNFYGGNGIVGAQVPIGAGLAFAHKYKKDGGISVAIYGDGAANQGQIYEASNMAALWKLPVVFMCENNQYGMGTSTQRAAASDSFYTRGDFVPGIWVDGMDVLAMRTGMQFAADWCRSGKGPIFFEANTYRYHGHSMSDPGVSYRSRDEVSAMRANRDCIDSLRKRLLDQGWLTEKDVKAIDQAVKKQIEEESQKAKASPLPKLEETYTDIYAGQPPPFIRATELNNSIVAPS